MSIPLRYLLTYADYAEYEIDGKRITTSTLQGLNLTDRIDSNLAKGYQSVKFNLQQTPLNLASFPELPGIYEMKVSRRPAGKKAKGFINIPVEAKLLKGVDLKPHGQEPEALIVMGGKFSRVQQDGGKVWSGVSVYLLDPNTRAESTDNIQASGIYCVDESLEGMQIAGLRACPGWYVPLFRTTRDNKGQELVRLAGLKFLSEVKMEDLLGVGGGQKPQ
jgi:hypothetical protein